ncbi:MAG TPA: response regulator transcription factor [Kofleriaceae bacterium]|jgi:DNA-binding response OmpR family regulator|nr:response regulator transcription factor [Kofleriaceae bacterium]
MRLALIEDDERIGEFVHNGLAQDGHVVDWVRTGDDGLALLLATHYDAAVIDVMLPGKSGLDVIRGARARKLTTPIIVLSARDSVDDRIAGLEAGADDYLTKPFSFAELLARVHALVRRASTAAEPFVLRFADVTLDLRTRRVERAGGAIQLQAKEFTLLEYLLRNAERVLSKTMILEHVWEYGFDPQTNVVDVLVSRLRAKIDRDYPRKLIHTLRGAGYVLRSEA